MKEWFVEANKLRCPSMKQSLGAVCVGLWGDTCFRRGGLLTCVVGSCVEFLALWKVNYG